ncbi:cadherin domain-containing protein [Marivirga salinae]|uniref:Cadherin domain-containing protein n=1 Tax=Marivirga salinarum TaxID=3059078 RepID=A0AA51NAW9_9BACT|nr:cadherin domain-containing protein [Marivirga sp. BDSF4-3]WMN11600.1 cadherin domain-containing protein [Marivirga sp. BDSF4-3]
MKKCLFLSFVFLILLQTIAKPQAIDENFKPIIGGAVYVRDAALQSDDKLLISGNFLLAGETLVKKFIRLNADGSVDETFNLDEGFDGQVFKFAVRSDGKILVFVRYSDSFQTDLILLNGDGSIDQNSNFGQQGYLNVGDLLFDGDNRLYVANYSEIIRFNSDGSVDDSFSIKCSNRIRKIDLTPDDKLLVSGEFSTINGIAKNDMARFALDGSIDNTFDIGEGADTNISNFEILPSGKYLITGRFSSVSGIPYNQLARLNNDGTVDNTFNSNAGFNSGNFIEDLVVDGSGRIVLGGNFQYPRTRIVRLLEDGTVDNSFDVGSGFKSERTTASLPKVFVKSDGKIIAVGNFTNFNGSQRLGVATLLTDGSLDVAYNAMLAATPLVDVNAIQTDGKVLIGGSFFRVGSTERVNLARLNTDGTIDESFDAGKGPNQRVHSMAIQADGKILLGGEFSEVNGSIERGLVRLNSNGQIDPSFSTHLSRVYSSDGVFKFHIQADGKIIIGGGFRSINGTDRNHFARLNPDGSLDASFNANDDIPGRVRAMKVLPNGNILVAGYNPNNPGFISMRDSDGNSLTSFTAPNMDLPGISAIEIQPDGKIVVGGASANGSGLLVGSNLFRLNQDGSLDNTFEKRSGLGKISEIAALPGGDLLIGDHYEGGLFRYSKDGVLDADFHWSINGSIISISDYNESFILSGAFTKIGESTSVYSIAKLNSTLVNAPSELTIAEESPILSWKDNATDETGVNVYRSTEGNTVFTQVASLGANETSFEDTDFQSGVQYYYKVRAVRNGEKSSFSITEAFPTIEVPKVEGLKFNQVSSNSIELKWSYINDNSDYTKIVRTEDGLADVTTYLKNYPSTFKSTGLEPGTEYTFTLTKQNKFGVSEPVSITVSTLSQGLKRTEAISFVLGGEAYIGLGRNETGLLQDFLKMDISDNSTLPVSPLPGPARKNAIAFVLNQKAYVGLGEDAFGNYLKDMYQYNPMDNSWTELNEFAGAARTSPVSFVIDGKAYVGTGYDGTNALADFYQYDVATDSWTATAAFSGEKRREAVAFVINGKAYVAGGFYVDGTTFQLSDAQEFDPNTESWKEVVSADINLGRNNATAFVYGNDAYLTYGSKNNITKFNPTDFSTSDLGDYLSIDDGGLGPARADAQSFTVNGSPYFTGGTSGTTTEVFYGDFYNLSILNNAPSSISLSQNTLAENTVGNEQIGKLLAIDADPNDTHTFKLVSGDGVNDQHNNLFAISEGELTYISAEAINYEALKSLKLFVEATDNKGASYKQAIVVNVLDRNDKPIISAASTVFSTEENKSYRSIIGTIAASDEDGDNLSFSVINDNEPAISIDFRGEIKIIRPSLLDFETNSTLVYDIVAHDGFDSSEETQITINLIDVNERPSISVASSNLNSREYPAEGTLVTALTGTDQDGDEITYSISSGNTAEAFMIVGNELRVNDSTVFNHSVNPDFSLTISGSDGELTHEIEVFVQVLPNNVPTSIELSPNVLSENVSGSVFIGLLSATDPDQNETHNFQFVDGDGVNDEHNHLFEIDDDNLNYAGTSAVNFEENQVLNLLIEVEDGSRGVYRQSIAVDVLDQNDIPEIIMDDPVFSIEENQAAGTLIGEIVAIDEDGDQLSYAIIEGNKDVFSIDENGNLLIADPAAFNFEQNETFALKVVAQDANSSSSAIELTVNVIDVNELPQLSLVNESPKVPENAPNGTIVAVLNASDEDGDVLRFSITDDSEIFSISENAEIVVSNKDLLDFETQSSHILGVKVTDGKGGVDEMEVTVMVEDVNEPLTIAVSTDKLTIEENESAGSLLATFTGVDEDGDDISFEIISGNENEAFKIDANDLLVNNLSGLNLTAPLIMELVVSGTDGEFTDELTVVITINNLVDSDPVTASQRKFTTTKPYPNPVVDQIVYMHLAVEGIDDVKAYDYAGKQYLIGWEIQQQTLKINCRDLPEGFYTILLQRNGAVEPYTVYKKN